MTLKTFQESLNETLAEARGFGTLPSIEEIDKEKAPKLKYKDVADLLGTSKVKSVEDLSTGKKVEDVSALATTIRGLSKNPQAKIYWSHDKSGIFIGVTETISKQYKIYLS